MTTPAAETSPKVLCHLCGYDLRAHPYDGKCPECGESVAESRRLARIPRRPLWRDSDPSWRRRILAGTWVLTFLPLLSVIGAVGWLSSIRVPALFGSPGGLHTLGDSLVTWFDVYQSLAFCVGMVCLFANERGTLRTCLDWTRRWGVLFSYLTFFLFAVQFLHILSLVCAAIAALFLSIPLRYQPEMTDMLVLCSTAYLRYGPFPSNIVTEVQVAVSSITVLLACIPLFEAIRSSSPKWLAVILVVPLGFFSLIHLVQVARFRLVLSPAGLSDMYAYTTYFRPAALLYEPIDLWTVGLSVSPVFPRIFEIELVKWCTIFAIAIWLSIAQFAARRHRSKVGVSE